jgi:predicted RNA-binding protein with PIN domain
VDALAELVKRVGTQVQLIFEEADLSAQFVPPAAALPGMRVTFAPEEAPADEVIMHLIDDLDAGQAVVVATNNRQLQQWSSRRGANEVSMAQLLAVLSRDFTPVESQSRGRGWRRRA